MVVRFVDILCVYVLLSEGVYKCVEMLVNMRVLGCEGLRALNIFLYRSSHLFLETGFLINPKAHELG